LLVTTVWLEGIFQDIRYAFRTMRRRPLVTIVSVLSLALGTGRHRHLQCARRLFTQIAAREGPAQIVLLCSRE